MWALWVSVFVKANIYKDNTTLKEIKDGQLAASLFFYIYIKVNKPNKINKHKSFSPLKKIHLHAVKVKILTALKVAKWTATSVTFFQNACSDSTSHCLWSLIIKYQNKANKQKNQFQSE